MASECIVLSKPLRHARTKNSATNILRQCRNAISLSSMEIETSKLAYRIYLQLSLADYQGLTSLASPAEEPFLTSSDPTMSN